MLNISNKSINHLVKEEQYISLKNAKSNYAKSYTSIKRMMLILFVIFFIILMLPWTQNVRAKGKLIALSPDQRPQTIQSVIGGRIEKWFVQEGQYVNQGDTILQISEVKDEYFDPLLLENTQGQIDAKAQSSGFYSSKAISLDEQIVALNNNMELTRKQLINKIEQSRLKVISDSIDLEAARINFNIAQAQYDRIKALHDEGLRSTTELENRRSKLQESQAKLITQENNWSVSINQLLNAKIELNAKMAEFKEKIAKAESEKFSALSSKYDTDAQVNKLKNSYQNYKMRTDLYYITAPQSGYITQALQVGIGETIKEGVPIVSIMPQKYDLAVEMYIRPIDLPLFQKGHQVMIQFDGWPAFVFSGWPSVSYGTYHGRVIVIDNFISENNLFRVLVKQDSQREPWPDALRVGGGVSTFTFLNNVQVWYEMWRQINGFPPDFYANFNKSNLQNPQK